ncbi:unnamed protein product, partial [Polarella glacialis]
AKDVMGDAPPVAIVGDDPLREAVVIQQPAVAVILEEEEEVKEAPPPVVEAPEPPSNDIAVRISRSDSDKLGLELDTSNEKFLPIVKVLAESAIGKWNKTCAAGSDVRHGDCIIKVRNEAGNSPELIEKMQTMSNDVELTIRRSKEFVIVLKRRPDVLLGINVASNSSAAIGLVITALNNGLVTDWNKNTTDKTNQVQVFDNIVAINGKEGTPEDLLHNLKDGSTPEVTMKILSWHV